jgi:hypothetical protein
MVDVEGKLELLGADLVSSDPEVGSFISAVFTLLWAETSEGEDDYLDKVRERTYQAIEECLDTEKVEKLRNILEEMRNVCEEYISIAKEDDARQERCLSLQGSFNEIKSAFMDMSYESVVFFVQFAVLHISLNVDIVVLFKSGHDALDEKNKQNLKDLINEYSLYAHKLSIKLVEFRLSQISTVCTCRLDHADPLVVRVSNGFK